MNKRGVRLPVSQLQEKYILKRFMKALHDGDISYHYDYPIKRACLEIPLSIYW
jgi:hypothetical protein